MNTHKHNLIILRTASAYQVPGWTKAEAWRTWDIMVSAYRTPEVPRDIQGRFYTFAPGSKSQGLVELCAKYGGILAKYDFIFIPDDDLEISQEQPDQIFRLCSEYRLVLAQPALTIDSFVSRSIVLANSQTRLRFTNWVEFMAPCFSQAAFQLCKSSFKENVSGWGQDNLWSSLLEGQRIGILDAVPVRHTRPLGGPNYDNVKHIGTSALCELIALHGKLGVRQPILRILGAVSNTGETWSRDEISLRPDITTVAPW